jgi:glucans biosynthesis protein C
MLIEKNAAVRRFDLDWLRIIAILAVFIFHCTRFFDLYGWHVKNPTTYQGVQLWTMFQSNWGMPLIFVISGASVYFSVTHISKYIKNKVLRLLVPLAVGVFTHVSIAVYLERVTNHQFDGSFFEFYPSYFHGFYGDGGNFAWMGLHLWYLLVLFVFSIIFLPLFYLLEGPWKNALAWLGDIIAKPGLFYLLALPIMFLAINVSPDSPFGGRNWGGWSLLCYIPFFLYGFLLISHAGLQTAVKNWRWVSFGSAIICTISLIYFYTQSGSGYFGSRQYDIINGLFGFNAWLWVVTIMGFGMKYLNFPTKFLFYANEAVLPFYILHQTVILIVGYYVTRWEIPDLAKFVFILVGSFTIVMSLYEFFIRRSNILRVLFGMKPMGKKQLFISNAPNAVGIEPS